MCREGAERAKQSADKLRGSHEPETTFDNDVLRFYVLYVVGTSEMCVGPTIDDRHFISSLVPHIVRLTYAVCTYVITE